MSMNVSLRGALLRALSIQGVPEKRRKHCIGWVRSYERFISDRLLQERSRENAESFIYHLQSRRLEPWQVAHAASTLKLLYLRVLGEKWVRSWAFPGEGDLLQRLDRAIRIRQYSYSAGLTALYLAISVILPGR